MGTEVQDSNKEHELDEILTSKVHIKIKISYWTKQSLKEKSRNDNLERVTMSTVYIGLNRRT